MIFSGNFWPGAVSFLVKGDNRRRAKSSSETRRAGFTLIEIMIVVAIMAVVMTMSVPMVYHMFRKEGMRKAVTEVVEVCSNARRQAIMSGTMSELIFHPKDRRFEISSAPARPKPENGEAPPITFGPPTHTSVDGGTAGVLSERLIIEMLDVNLIEYKDADEVHVRFYPNGTCDEMTLILHSDQNEWRKISLEVTTSLADVETDPNKFK
jgi:type II secretion system protein H